MTGPDVKWGNIALLWLSNIVVASAVMGFCMGDVTIREATMVITIVMLVCGFGVGTLR